MSRWDDYPVTLGQVVSVDTDAGLAMVEVSGSTVPAWLPDHLWLGTASGPAVSAGVTVTLLRMLGGFQVVSAYTGTDGGGAPTLGPELLANGGFESGPVGGLPDGWKAVWNFGTGEPQPWTITSDAPLEGAQAARCRVRPEFNHNSQLQRSLATRIDPGLTYNLSGFVSADIAAGTVNVALEVKTGETAAEAEATFSGGTTQTVASASNPGAAWPVLGGDFVTPAGHSYLRVTLRVTSGGSAGADAVVKFDALSLRQRLA